MGQNTVGQNRVGQNTVGKNTVGQNTVGSANARAQMQMLYHKCSSANVQAQILNHKCSSKISGFIKFLTLSDFKNCRQAKPS
jgi:hypothetical protein